LYNTKQKCIKMSSRLNTKSLVNAYFAQSGYMKPGINFWGSMNFESKQKFREFVNATRAKVGEGTAEEQSAAFASLLPPDLSSDIAKVWAADPKLKQFLVSKDPPMIGEQKEQLAIEGPMPLAPRSKVKALPAPKNRQSTRAIALIESKEETQFEMVPFVSDDKVVREKGPDDNYRVAKATLGPKDGRSGRKIAAGATAREKRLAKIEEGRKASSAGMSDFAMTLTTGMFGSAAEVVGGSGAAGTGIGAALLGGGSGSVLDRMIESNVSDSTLALVTNIGKMIVASGGGANDDRLLALIGSLVPRASEAISLIKNPALFPKVAYDHLAQTGVLSRLTQKAEDFGQSLLDKVAGRSPPVMRGIGALPPLSSSSNALTIVEADGKIVQHSQDAVMNRELQGRPLLNPATDSTERPQSAMEVAATNMVQAGVTGIRQKAGDYIGNLAQQGAIGLIDAASENLPIPDGLKDAFNTGAKNAANRLGDAVRDRIQQPGRQPNNAQSSLEIVEIDDDGDVKYDGDDGGVAPITAVSTRAQPPVRSPAGDGGDPDDTRMVPAQRPRSAFQPKPLIPAAARPVQPGLPSRTRPHRLVPGEARGPRNFPMNPQPDLFKRTGGARSRNRHPRMPTGRRPIAPRSEENKDGGDAQVTGGAPPPAPGGGEPSADIKARFQEENTSGTDELPLRPEVRRAGLDSLAWPTTNQVADKLQEATYYVPKHEGRGTMKDNPLVRQNVLEEALRFRNTNAMPREQVAPSYPAQAVRERVQMLLQNTYSTNNGEQKLNANVATSVTMSTPMMSTLYEPKPWMDVYIPAEIQSGGKPYTRAGPLYSLS
jgi:hypothetical protein